MSNGHNVFAVPDDLANNYHGAGIALAAVAGGTLVGLAYLRDIIDELDEGDDESIKRALGDPRLGPTVRYLSALGEVYVGMCSCHEFTEL